MALQFLLGLLLSALIGLLGYWRRSLSASGVLGAVLVGTAIFGLGGWAWGVLLVLFFVSSSVLSHFRAAGKATLAEKFSKGSRRDLGQVLANGGAGALIAVANVLWPHPAWWAAYVGALAAVNADTWATELGVLNGVPPRLITTGYLVEVGTSGAVSPLGTAAALAGAALISLAAAAFDFVAPGSAAAAGSAGPALRLALAGAAGGLFGSLIDSLLGATVQAIYYCDACGRETERHPRHRCGAPTRHVRGWHWLDNDLVNVACSLAGAALAGAVMLV